MVRKVLRSKLFFLSVCMLLIGFFIGYVYSVVTSRQEAASPASSGQRGNQSSEGINGLPGASESMIEDKDVGTAIGRPAR
jgi:type III secretory pathway component EscT